MTILEHPTKETTTKEVVSVKTYSAHDKPVWDSFVGSSKNGVFLFNRDYMEYHKDRFQDHSLLFYKNDRLLGLLPANISGDVLQSHGGLTFGGVVAAYSMKTPLMMEIFDALREHCQSLGLKEILYKPTPHIYHSVPAEEDLYALYRVNAQLVARGVSSAILMSQEKRFSDNRRASLRKAKKHNLTVKESGDFEVYMRILEQNLVERHGVKPVHTVDEIKLLSCRFPDNIKLYASFKDDIMLAGIIIYESPNVAHIQYAANSAEGLKLGAQDIVEEYLINERYKDKRYYDFGISTENQGRILNLGLIKFKEDFGASAVVYDVYQIVL
jgi:hypothetical protein